MKIEEYSSDWWWRNVQGEFGETTYDHDKCFAAGMRKGLLIAEWLARELTDRPEGWMPKDKEDLSNEICKILQCERDIPEKLL